MAGREELLSAIQQNYVANTTEEGSAVAPTKKDCTQMLKAVLQSISELAMQENGSVRTDIGTFKRTESAERTARNPKTNEPVVVAARAKLGFKPSSACIFIEGAEAKPAATPAKKAPAKKAKLVGKAKKATK